MLIRGSARVALDVLEPANALVAEVAAAIAVEASRSIRVAKEPIAAPEAVVERPIGAIVEGVVAGRMRAAAG